MSDLTTYFVYDPAFDREAKVSVVKQYYDIPNVEPADDFENVKDWIRDLSNISLSFSYASITPRLEINYEDDQWANEPDLPSMRLALSDQYFLTPFSNEDDEKAYEHIADFVNLTVEIYNASREVGYPPLYVFGADPRQVTALRGDRGMIRTTTEGILNGEVEQLYWLQILPPPMVDAVGRDRLLSAPAWRVEELDNDAILLVTIALPESPTQEYADILDYLSFEPDW